MRLYTPENNDDKGCENNDDDFAITFETQNGKNQDNDFDKNHEEFDKYCGQKMNLARIVIMNWTKTANKM